MKPTKCSLPFTEFFDGTGDFSFYFHIPAFFGKLWVLMPAAQPILSNSTKEVCLSSQTQKISQKLKEVIVRGSMAQKHISLGVSNL